MFGSIATYSVFWVPFRINQKHSPIMMDRLGAEQYLLNDCHFLKLIAYASAHPLPELVYC